MTDEACYAAVLEHMAQAAVSGEPGIYLGQTVHGDLPVVLPYRTFKVHGSFEGPMLTFHPREVHGVPSTCCSWVCQRRARFTY